MIRHCNLFLLFLFSIRFLILLNTQTLGLSAKEPISSIHITFFVFAVHHSLDLSVYPLPFISDSEDVNGRGSVYPLHLYLTLRIVRYKW